MKSYDDRCMDVLACAIQHGNADPQIMVHLTNMKSEVFCTNTWLRMYQILTRYFKLTGTMISRNEFVDLIESARSLSKGECAHLIKEFSNLETRDVKAGAFPFYQSQLIDWVMENRSHVLLDDAREVLTRTESMDLETCSGYEAMKRILLKGMYSLDRVISEDHVDGNVREEMNDVLEEYVNLQEQRGAVNTGFTEIDKCTGGLHPGELWLLVGYTGEGKSFSCINIAHNAAFVQGKNVVYFTSETVRSVVRRRLTARHAMHLNNKGIDLTAWKKGTLEPEAYESLREALADMQDPEKGYGVFHVAQMPASATTDYISAALTQYQTSFNVDLCILDSIHLLQPKKERNAAYVEFEDMLIETKKIIVSHNKGRGVPLISPWHTNRAGWEEARENGRYTKASLAKSSEAERQADVILSILRQDSGREEMRGSILKNRDGEELDEFYLKVDFSQGYIGDSVVPTSDDILDFKAVLHEA